MGMNIVVELLEAVSDLRVAEAIQLHESHDEFPPEAYGYWIKEDGSVKQVDFQAHTYHAPRGYTHAFNQGWIKVSTYPLYKDGQVIGKEMNVELQYDRVTRAAVETLRRLLKTQVWSRYNVNIDPSFTRPPDAPYNHYEIDRGTAQQMNALLGIVMKNVRQRESLNETELPHAEHWIGSCRGGVA